MAAKVSSMGVDRIDWVCVAWDLLGFEAQLRPDCVHLLFLDIYVYRPVEFREKRKRAPGSQRLLSLPLCQEETRVQGHWWAKPAWMKGTPGGRGDLPHIVG